MSLMSLHFNARVVELEIHSEFKIRRLRDCRFDSCHAYQFKTFFKKSLKKTLIMRLIRLK